MPSHRPPSPANTCNILGFDTSGPYCAIGLHQTSGDVTTRFEQMPKGQAENLVPMLEELLADQGLTWSDLDALAVGIGPGNFTGIRISVSAARGLALGLGIPVLPVTNFESLLGPDPLAESQTQLVCLPAPRGASYAQLFENAQPSGQAFVISHAPAIIKLPPDTQVIGPNAPEIAALYEHRVIPIERKLVPEHTPTMLLQIAVNKWATGALSDDRPAPLYIKPPDAAPSRDTPPQTIL